MIKVYWPMDDKIPDSIICEWLDDLIKQSPDKVTFELHGDQTLYFVREDDAIAFKLKFGL